MADINAYTAVHMQEIVDNTIVNGTITNNNLILVKKNSAQINCGQVNGLPASPNQNYSGSTYVCTSLTRPKTPSVGQMIYETDTGAELVYYGTTTGWNPPWNLPWGSSAPAKVSTGQTSISGTPYITDTELRVTYKQTLNRLLKVTCFGQVHTSNAASTFQTMVLYIRDSGGVVLNTTSVITESYNYSTGVNFQHVFTAGTTGTVTLKLSATRSAGAEGQYFGARTSVLWTDPYTNKYAYMLVEDIGPGGAVPTS